MAPGSLSVPGETEAHRSEGSLHKADPCLPHQPGHPRVPNLAAGRGSAHPPGVPGAHPSTPLSRAPAWGVGHLATPASSQHPPTPPTGARISPSHAWPWLSLHRGWRWENVEGLGSPPTMFLKAREVSPPRPPADGKFQSPLPSSPAELSFPMEPISSSAQALLPRLPPERPIKTEAGPGRRPAPVFPAVQTFCSPQGDEWGGSGPNSWLLGGGQGGGLGAGGSGPLLPAVAWTPSCPVPTGICHRGWI